MSKLIRTFEVVTEDGPRSIRLVGRFAQTAEALVTAGPRGITALDLSNWAVRLSHYVFILRKDHGLNIEMMMEGHDGPFPGHHGRYVLTTPMRLITDEREAA
jgi:hypothetical protein